MPRNETPEKIFHCKTCKKKIPLVKTYRRYYVNYDENTMDRETYCPYCGETLLTEELAKAGESNVV